MERFSQRESTVLAYYPQRSSTNSSTPNGNSDVDFHDVFGGPPPRSSIHKMQQREDEATSCPWPLVHEKPVFGEDIVNKRRYPNNGFFDDIFRCDESVSSTLRIHERGPFSAGPGTILWSPAPPLPPRVEPFGTPSRPPTFSLTPSLTNGKDDISNGLSSSDGRSNQDKGGNMKQDLSSSSSQASLSSGQFHFSIYKWASKGVPFVMPLRAERNSRTKENVKIERCSSAKEWMVSESTTENDNPLAYIGPSSMKNKKLDDDGSIITSTQNGEDSRQIIEEISSANPQSETLSSLQNVIQHVPGSAIYYGTTVHSGTHAVREIGFSGKTKGDSVYANETHEPELKPLHFVFNKNDKQGYDRKTKKERGKKNRAKGSDKSSATCDISVNPQKREEKTVALKGVEVTKATSLGTTSLDDNLGRDRIRGKVKEFVRIFNQGALSKPRVEPKSQMQGHEYVQRGALKTKNEVEDYPEHLKENLTMETTSKAVSMLFPQDDFSASEMPDSSVAEVLDQDGSSNGNFLIKELAQDESEVLRTQYNKEIQVIDAKIKQWSNGKEGNIRSLLSTLQYVLWPESGWKPVPLVDIIEGNAVKKTYQRALLCLHPDKLQQKGAASQQKYIAEKVYDTLQEAWTHFNMFGVQ